MIRSNAVRVEVREPTVGLFTRVPSDAPDRKAGRALTVAQNVRAERGVLMNAPGYERIVPAPANLDSAANLIFQAEITNSSPDVRMTPIIATGGKVYVLHRKAQALVCGVGECRLTAALFGDTQANSAGITQVRDLVASWDPDVVCHLGDLSYDPGLYLLLYPIEEMIGQHYYRWIGGYNGFFGIGPESNQFFPVVGNHDWTDYPISDFYDFFNIPSPKRYYSFKRGPVQFCVFSSDPQEPDGISSSSTQGIWLQAAISSSDCPWRVVLMHHPSKCSDELHYPGYPDLEWIRSIPGVSAICTGHAHNMELVYGDGEGKAPLLICGTGGSALRGFAETPVEGSLFRHSGDYGALRMEANAESCTFYFTAVDGTVLHELQLAGPNEGSGVCYISDAAKQLATLEIRPAQVTVEAGYSWPLEAWLTTIDGNVRDVTSEVVWTSADDNIAVIGSKTGWVTGRSEGTVTVNATYGNTTVAGAVNVLVPCVDPPLDVVMVVERSESSSAAAGSSNRMTAFREGAGLLVDNLLETDRVGLVSFADTARLDSALTDDFAGVKDALSFLLPDGSRDLAGALAAARAELTARGRPSSDKMVVVVLNGMPDDPVAAQTEASLLKDAGVTVMVVGYGSFDVFELLYLSLNIATPGYWGSVISPENLKQFLSNVPHYFCQTYYYP